MAYINGNATNYRTLLSTLRDFVVANGWELIGGQAGAIGADDFISLRGPGLAGNDEILLSLETVTNVPAGQYCISITGHTAYAKGNPSPDPPGLSSPRVYAPLIDSTIRYWMVANGRRFIVVAKSNNRYDVIYGGMVMPDHLPSDWPYPVLVGASSTVLQAGSSDRVTHSNFWRSPGCGYLFTPQQTWKPFENVVDQWNVNNGYEAPFTGGRLMAADWKTNVGVYEFARTLDNQPWLRRGRIIQTAQPGSNEARNFLGHFDGVFYTQAVGAIVEGTIRNGGKNYLVVPNVYRNTSGQMAAICLE